MTLTQKLYNSTKDIWQKYHTHPFIIGMADGSLQKDIFRFYLIQDYLYLLDYAKVFALGVVKSDDEIIMKKFAKLLNDILNSEMNIHNKYKDKLDITEIEIKNSKKSLANTSYTKYMLEIGYSKDILHILVTVLACSWSYKEIGENLYKNSNISSNNFYYDWICGYSSQSYENDNNELLKIIDDMGKNCSEKEYNELEEIFINCSRYEYNFWEMAYKKEL